jgi:hypothetical protein
MHLAAQVTSLFYLIDAATNDVVEGGKVDQQRPPWLGESFLYFSVSPTLQLLGY